jgi:hypothetical protein
MIGDAYNTAIGKRGKIVVPVVDIYEGGHVEVKLQYYAGLGGTVSQYVNGVYSTEVQ